MGIGSLFASFFKKEEDGHKEIRELNIAPEHKERRADKTEHRGSPVEKEKSAAEAVSVRKFEDKPEKARRQVRDGADAKSAKRVDNHPEEQADNRSEGRTHTRSGDRPDTRPEEQADNRSEGRTHTRSGDRPDSRPEEQTDNRVKENLDSRTGDDSEGRAGEGAERSDNRKSGARSKEKDPYYQAKKDLYHYINGIMRQLYKADQEEGWDSIASIDPPSDSIKQALDRIREELPEKHWSLAAPFMEEGNLAAPAELKTSFYAMLLPFYPMYSSYFKEFKYNTFLNREALELFRQLTGRKFRLGYRNRYATGPNAFEWEGQAYRVYDCYGFLLCDAVFEDGEIKDGYAVLPPEADDDPDWMIRRKGIFKDGRFTDGAVEYIYKKPVDI